MTTTSPALTLPAEDAFAGFLLALEDHAGAFEDEARAAVRLELVADAGGLDHAAFGRELAVENRQAAVRRVGGVLGADAILRVEHERRVVRHQAAGLRLLELRRAGIRDRPC